MTQSTTFNTPNYLGILHLLKPAEAPFYSMIGAKAATASKDFEWTLGDRTRGGSQADVALEGATKTASGGTRSAGSNVCQIHHESYEITYTKMAATGNHDGLNILGDASVMDEKSYQAMLKLAKLKEDIEWSFLHGVYAKPADNATPRKTRGVLTAATTNVVAAGTTITLTSAEADDETFTANAAHGLAVNDEVELATVTGGTGLTAGTTYFVKTVPSSTTFTVSTSIGGATTTFSTDVSAGTFTKKAPLNKARIDKLLRTMKGNGAPTDDLVIVANSFNRQQISSIYGYAPADRTVGGLAIDTILTDFGRLGVVYDRFVDADVVGFINTSVCRPRVLPIPGKGFLFEEQLAKVGSSESYQIYGEIGLEYGPEDWHGQITGLTTDEAA